MLIDLLTQLNSAMKAEDLRVPPEKLCQAAQYMLLSPSLFPEPNIQDALLPVLISRIEDEPAYHRAWKRLMERDLSSGEKMALYGIFQGEESFSSPSPPLSREGLGWEPWQEYLEYKKHADWKAFEGAVIGALARGEEPKDWEIALEEALKKMFTEQKQESALDHLLKDALTFRKEFSKIKRNWNKIMKAALATSKNTKDKMGEKKAPRPVYTEGWRANIQRWGAPELFMRPMEEIREEDLLELQEPIRKMAEQLRIRLERMRGRRGSRIDVRKTIQASYKTFGEPLKIIPWRPRRKPARWIILSDVSGSVKHATRLFMSFLFELRQVMDENIRGFAFVSETEEITHILKETDYQRMQNRIYQEGEIDFRGYSDYGVAFQYFEDLAGDCLDSASVLLIIGDARNNRRDPRLDLLRKWSIRARKIIWFNPDLPEKWDQGDSIISAYAKLVNQVFDVSTPGKLVRAIEKIVI